MTLVYELATYEGGQKVDHDPLVDQLDRPGVPLAGSWVPFEVELVSREGRSAFESVDAPQLIGNRFLVLKESAVPGVAEDLAPYAEFLPLLCPQEPLVLVNVITVVDAVDEQASQLKRFSNGRIMRIDRVAFDEDALPAQGVFRVPQAVGRMFCTEATATVLRERLTGVNLRPVWEG